MSDDNQKASGPGREGLLAAFRAVRDALLAGDRAAIRELYAEDFRAHSLLGEVEGLPDVLAAYGPGGVRLDVFEVEDLSAEVFGEVGLLTGLGQISGRFDKSEFRYRVRFVDVYLWRDGRWRYYFSQSTEIAPDPSASI
jgi:ketosteroid isomerase-like protein